MTTKKEKYTTCLGCGNKTLLHMGLESISCVCGWKWKNDKWFSPFQQIRNINPTPSDTQREERKPLMVAMEEVWEKLYGKENEGIMGLEMFKNEHHLRLLQKLVESYWYEREREFRKDFDRQQLLKEVGERVSELLNLPRKFWEDEDHSVGGYISKKDLKEKLQSLTALLSSMGGGK